MSKATCMDMDGYDLYLLVVGEPQMQIGHFKTKEDMDHLLEMHFINPLRNAGVDIYKELSCVIIYGIVRHGDSWFYDPDTTVRLDRYYKHDFKFDSYKETLYC